MCALSLKHGYIRILLRNHWKQLSQKDMAYHQSPTKMGRRGGGIALIYNKRTVTLVDSFSSEFTDTECALFRINVNQKHLDLYVLYQYPKGSLLTYFEDPSNVIERYITSGNSIVDIGWLQHQVRYHQYTWGTNSWRLLRPLQPAEPCHLPYPQ